MLMNKRKKVFGIILSAIMLLSVASVGTASAAVTKHPEKNGTWCYSLEPRKVTSQYYHTTKRHEYFVVGDNYKNSYDSRNYGCINQQEIIGKVLL